MELAVSNIAWESDKEPRIYELLQNKQVQALEIAPTRVWSCPDRATAPEVNSFLEIMSRHQLRTIAFQALLFGKQELQIFERAQQHECLTYLCALIDLAAKVGARALVFGSPKNRVKGGLDDSEAFERAVEFFRQLGDYAALKRVFICLEPNPKAYGCDFINTTAEGARLVRAVNSPGFKLHFDTGALHMNNEDIEGSIAEHIELAVHFHVSEPYLGDLTCPQVDHGKAARALRRSGYSGPVSIEMRATQDSMKSVSTAIDFVKDTYL